MHVLTLVANSTLLSYIKRIFGTHLQAGTVGMVLTRQKGIEQSTVQRHGKEVGSKGKGGGGSWGSLTLVESDALFSKIFIFYRMHETLW